MYIIGIFLTTNEVEVVPEEWLADTSTLVKSSTQCWWPPYKSSGKTAKAVSSREQVDTTTWSEYSIKVIGRYETFEEARRKLPKATDTSNLDTTDDEVMKGKRKRQRNKFLIEDEETSEEDLHDESKLPMPPKYRKDTNKSNQEASISATEKTIKSKTLCLDRSSPININNQNCASPRNDIPDIQIDTQDCSSRNMSFNRNQDCSSPRNVLTKKDQNQDLQSRTDLMLLRRDVLDIKFKLNRLLESFEDLKDKIVTTALSTEVTEQSTEESEVIISITNKFPLSEEDLATVENMLEDAKIKNNLKSYLNKYGGSNVKAATFTLLRLIFSDATGSKYSWIGAKKKKNFSSLTIFEAMSDAIRGRFKDATVEEISVHVKTWLRNAPTRILLKQKPNQ